MVPTTTQLETNDSEVWILKKLLMLANAGGIPVAAEITAEMGPTNTLLTEIKTAVDLVTTAVGTNRTRSVLSSIVIGGNATYAQYDVMGPAVTASIPFANVAEVAGGGGFIIGAQIEFEAAALPTAMASTRLRLFNVVHAGIADNAAMALAVGSIEAAIGYIGYIDFPTPELVGATLVAQGTETTSSFVSTLPKPFKCAAAGTGLWGLLETRAAISGTVPTSMPCNITLTIQPGI